MYELVVAIVGALELSELGYLVLLLLLCSEILWKAHVEAHAEAQQNLMPKAAKYHGKFMHKLMSKAAKYRERPDAEAHAKAHVGGSKIPWKISCKTSCQREKNISVELLYHS